MCVPIEAQHHPETHQTTKPICFPIYSKIAKLSNNFTKFSKFSQGDSNTSSIKLFPAIITYTIAHNPFKPNFSNFTHHSCYKGMYIYATKEANKLSAESMAKSSSPHLLLPSHNCYYITLGGKKIFTSRTLKEANWPLGGKHGRKKRGVVGLGRKKEKGEKKATEKIPKKKEQPKIDLVYTLELALLHHKHKPLHSSRRPLLPYLGWVTFPQFSSPSFFFTPQVRLLWVGIERKVSKLQQFAHKRRERLRRRERESMAAGAYAVLKYVLLYNTKNPNTIE